MDKNTGQNNKEKSNDELFIELKKEADIKKKEYERSKTRDDGLERVR